MIKQCFKCKRKKNINLFYKHKEMKDGYLGKCKKCTKKDVQDRYDDPESRIIIAEYEKKRFKNPKRKEKIRLYQIKRRALFKGKNAARNIIGNYVRDGKLTKKPCEKCGDIKSQAHHKDYRKPLDVLWLCFRHHREEHGQKVL